MDQDITYFVGRKHFFRQNTGHVIVYLVATGQCFGDILVNVLHIWSIEALPG